MSLVITVIIDVIVHGWNKEHTMKWILFTSLNSGKGGNDLIIHSVFFLFD